MQQFVALSFKDFVYTSFFENLYTTKLFCIRVFNKLTMIENTFVLDSNQFKNLNEFAPTLFVALYAICVKTPGGASIGGKSVKILPIFREYGNFSDASFEYAVPSNLTVGDCKIFDEIKWSQFKNVKGFLVYEHKQLTKEKIMGLYDQNSAWNVQVMISPKQKERLTPEQYPYVIEQLKPTDCLTWKTTYFFGKNCTFVGDDVCLNWRLRGGIGAACLNLINGGGKDLSITNFCNAYKYAEDCKCVNRHLHQDYIDEKPKRQNQNDYAWYLPCSCERYLMTGLKKY